MPEIDLSLDYRLLLCDTLSNTSLSGLIPSRVYIYPGRHNLAGWPTIQWKYCNQFSKQNIILFLPFCIHFNQLLSTGICMWPNSINTCIWRICYWKLFHEYYRKVNNTRLYVLGEKQWYFHSQCITELINKLSRTFRSRHFVFTVLVVDTLLESHGGQIIRGIEFGTTWNIVLSNMINVWLNIHLMYVSG